MVQVFCPNEGWIFKYKDYEGDGIFMEDPPGSGAYYDKDGTPKPDYPLPELDNTFDQDGVIKFSFDMMDEDFEQWFYYVDEDGISLSAENKIYQMLKASSPPSFFDIFEIYIEDCNGISATYGLNDIAIGKENVVDISALVRGEDFNDSFVTKVGYHISGPKTSRKLMIQLHNMRATYLETPIYCTPQEVMDFLMLVDNRGEPFKVTETSIPSYNTIAKRIVEAEAFIENTTRTAFVERRIDKEIRNADSAWPGTYGYYGILATSGFDYGAQSFFKGCPVKLSRSNILPIDYSKGDLVEIRRYGSYWTTVPNEMIWQDETKGIVYVKSLFFQKDASIRVTYRYGKGPVPQDLKRACILKTALLVMQTEWYVAKFPQSPDFLEMRANAMNSWTWELRDLLRPYSTAISVGGV